MMQRYHGLVRYHGARFYGWQKQSNLRSVQGELEAALALVQKKPSEIFGAGRTDAGVHAYAQSFHFDSSLNLDSATWVRALNAYCPSDLRVSAITPVRCDFHARYDTIGKWYRYVIECGPYSVFERELVLQYNRPLDLDVLRQGAALFRGIHDFSSYNATPPTQIANQVRDLQQFDIFQEGTKVIFDLKGTGFLRYMVRMLVGSLVRLSQGKMSLEQLQRALAVADKHAINDKVDSCGLYLMEVYYKEESL